MRFPSTLPSSSSRTSGCWSAPGSGPAGASSLARPLVPNSVEGRGYSAEGLGQRADSSGYGVIAVTSMLIGVPNCFRAASPVPACAEFIGEPSNEFITVTPSVAS